MQTIQYPARYFEPLLSLETAPLDTLPLSADALRLLSTAPGEAPRGLCDTRDTAAPAAAPEPTALTRTDDGVDPAHFPPHVRDLNGCLLDLRPSNSWTTRLGDVATVELAEVFAVNAMAPFVLCSRLRPAMESPFLLEGAVTRRAAFIVNVSSMEGTCPTPWCEMLYTLPSTAIPQASSLG